VNGSETTVVVLGIGDGVNQTELEYIASEPHHLNLILLSSFYKLRLHGVQEQVLNATCRG